jgi:hypothetical protein
MQEAKKTISPLVYFVILTSLINLIFIIIGIAILAPLYIKLDQIAVIVIVILLLCKGGVVGFITWLFQKQSHNKEFAVKFIGLYYGRFFGIFIGGFCGGRIALILRQADIIGFFIGALALYFIGRWIGPKVSIAIDNQLDKVVSIPEYQAQPIVVKTTPLIRLILFLSVAVLPWLLVVIALVLYYFDIPRTFFVEWLPIARIIVIVLSVLSICYPLLMKKGWLIKFRRKISSPESYIPLLGLSLSVVPVIYGMVLFLAMGTSIIELCVYAVISSTVAIVWIRNIIPR